MKMFILIRRKYTQAVVVLLLLLLLSITFYIQAVQDDKRKSMGNIFDEISEWMYLKYFQKFDKSSKSNEEEAKFNEQVDAIYEESIKNEESSLWTIDLSARRTVIEVPEYFYEKEKKPIIQPFDARFTLGVVLSHMHQNMDKGMLEKIKIPFHWYDWLDMSVLNQYLLAPDNLKPNCDILDATNAYTLTPEMEKAGKKLPAGALQPSMYCFSDADLPSAMRDLNQPKIGFNSFRSDKRTTPERAILGGKSYLYTFAPPPSLIIFLTEDGSYRIEVGERKKIVDTTLVDEYIAHAKSSQIDPVTQFHLLKEKIPSSKTNTLDEYQIDLTDDMFRFDYENIMKDLEEKFESSAINESELNYLNGLKFSVDTVQNKGPPKYFSEANLLGSAIGDHYDWRFFNGVMYDSFSRSLVLQRLIRAWLSFSRKSGIKTWVAHGSLLSWYWNGMAFPWDYDIDVQVPIMDLHRLTLEFNQSLVVENIDEGYGRYLVDCGSFITLREKGNSNNNIDARFIDIDTGLYIDITGLALSNTKTPDRYKELYPSVWKDTTDYVELNSEIKAYNCRNNHFSTLKELSPLVKTFVEGEVSYVPRSYSDILTVEYAKGLKNKKFAGHIYVPQLRIWFKEENLFYFLKDREKWKVQKYNSEYTFINSEQDINKLNVKYELTDEQKKQLISDANLRKENNAQRTSSTRLLAEDIQELYDMKQEDFIDLMTKDEVLAIYYLTRDFTAIHEREMMKLLFSKSTQTLIEEQSPFPPFRLSFIDYKMISDDYDYTAEVSKYMAQSSEFTKNNDN